MAAPTIVYAWSSQAAATTSTATPAVSVGDLAIVWKAGTPGSVGTGVPSGFSTAKVDTSNDGTTRKASVFYKVLASGDISGGNLIAVDMNVGGTTNLRIGLLVVRHANGWDSSTCLVQATSFNTNAAAPQTVSTMTDVARPAVGFTVYCGSTGSNSQQFTWAGAPTGFTSARDPYFDESSTTYTLGGHTTSRTDSGVGLTNGSATATDSSITANDLGAVPNVAGMSTGQIISITPGVQFTNSTAYTGATITGNVTFLVPHYGTNTNTVQADYQQFDVSDTPGTVTQALSTATNTYVNITAEFQAQQNIYTSSPTDTASASDSISTRTGLLHAATSDTAAASDSVVYSLNGRQNLTDTAAASDVKVARVVRLVTETASASDSAARVFTKSLTETAHATDSVTPYNSGLVSFRLGDPGSGPFSSVDLKVYAKKMNVGDIGDIRLSLYDGVGAYWGGYYGGYGGGETLIAQGDWQALTDTVTLYDLTVGVSTFAQSDQLVAVIEARSPSVDNLAADISWVYLDAESGVSIADGAGAVDSVTRSGHIRAIVTDSAPATESMVVGPFRPVTDSAPAIDTLPHIVPVLGRRVIILTATATSIRQDATARIA